MDFSLSGILAGFIFGTFGLYVMRAGKQRANFYLLVTGILMMVYPYFVSSKLAEWGIGFALCGASYYYWDKY